MEKVLSVFVDESGDAGFEGEASKYFVVSLILHDQSNDISSQINKIKNDPVFHVGPIVRREEQYHNFNIKERKVLLNRIRVFFSIIPITYKVFIYKKKEFENNADKLLQKIRQDIRLFLLKYYSYFSSFSTINIYYDLGQQIVSRALVRAFDSTLFNVVFKRNVKNENYRLSQVADYVASIQLTNLNIGAGEISKSEERFFIDKNIFRRIFFKSLSKKEFK